MAGHKTAQEVMPSRYIHTDTKSNPEPPFDPKWSELEKLTWSASLIMSEYPGVRLFIIEWPEQLGEYSISYNSGGMSATSYKNAWEILTGIELGLSIAAHLSKKKE